MSAAATERIDLAREPDFAFGDVLVSPGACRLIAAVGELRLQPRVMQVLVALARAGGMAVSRDDLMRACWGDLFVGEDALNRCIQRLRHIARDRFGEAFVIETVPRVGYRLCADPPASAGAIVGRGEGPSRPSALTRPTIAVAPFSNIGADVDQDYFARGMFEEIVGALARFKSIAVMPLGGDVHPRRFATPREAARRLRVRYLLEGSVRRSADRVRISVKLIDGEDGAQIWAERFEDAFTDLFALQDRVALRIAGVIEPTVQDVDVRRAASRATDNMNAYDLYLRSDTLFRSFTREDTLAAIDLLDRAIELDPGFALACGHSAVCHRQVLDYLWRPDPEAVRRRGLDLAETALRLAGADDKVLAHVAVALPGLEGRLDRASTLISRSLAANPGSAFAWLISGVIGLRRGDCTRASEDLHRSLELDSLSRASDLARMYLAMAWAQRGQAADVIASSRSTSLRLPVSHVALAAAHAHVGEAPEAREELRCFRRLTEAPAERIASIWFPGADQRRWFLEGLALVNPRPSISIVR